MTDQITPRPVDTSQLICGDPSTDLSSNRTSLSLERTRLSADRTLMSSIRTGLSLISFGFTIFQLFRQIAEKHADSGAVTAASARNFGLCLLLLGVATLVAGLVTHVQLMMQMRQRTARLFEAGLLRRGPIHQTSSTAIIAILLLALGVVSVIGMIVRAGPLR